MAHVVKGVRLMNARHHQCCNLLLILPILVSKLFIVTVWHKILQRQVLQQAVDPISVNNSVYHMLYRLATPEVLKEFSMAGRKGKRTFPPKLAALVTGK